MLRKMHYEVFFAVRHHKLMHLEQYYAITYDIKNKVYVIWALDGAFRAHQFESCKDKEQLAFTWKVLMDRGEPVCLL